MLPPDRSHQGLLLPPKKLPNCIQAHLHRRLQPHATLHQGGLRGGSVESWRQASTFMLGVAAFFVLAGIVFGTWVASVDDQTTAFDGLIAFLFLSPFMLFAGGVGLFLRYVIPRMQEGWYR
ncbi:zinc ribbon domain-containing protein [Paracoccus pantotrophus]|uniref:zinc ribbon domain-containing protein n=1 Tax=Paracoccus pantotrophus TaxID=82367 RepID=UPI002181F0BF|nr:zinc ribbon domain-containing protein [Paracoccus pantotrophus]